MGKLTFYHGVMGSGKSEEIIKIYRNYKNVGIDPMVWSYSADMRFGDEFGVHSRNGDSVPALPFSSITDFDVNLTKQPVIMIDEGQFLTPNQVEELSDLVDYSGIDVLVFGLRTDFQSRFFPGSQTLMELADKLIELKSLCAICTKKAILNGRFVDGEQVYEGEQIVIGHEEYKGLCRKHWKSKNI